MDTLPAGGQHAQRPTRLHRLPSDLDHEVREHRRRRVRATAALTLLGALGGVVVGLALQSVLPLEPVLSRVLWAVSVLAATVGTYGVLILLVLVARLPVLERGLGQDRLVAWHRRIAPWSLALVAVHVILVVAGEALDLGLSWPAQLWSLVTGTRWILPALVGLLLLAAAAVSSWPRIRRRMRRGTWWTVHLYTYLGVALAFAHQITAGGPFLSGGARILWAGLYLAVFGSIVVFRVAVPLWNSWRAGLRVTAVVPESSDTVSVWMHGRSTGHLGILPGQFLNVRFLAPGLLWEAHPYSVSGVRDGGVRITVKALGDASALTGEVPVDTRVLVEGPYGALTPGLLADDADRVVLVAAGAGITPVRALAGSLAGRIPLDIVYRASASADHALVRELHALGRRPGVRVHLLAGPRRLHPLTPAHLGALLGPLHGARLYVCGPASFQDRVLHSAAVLGAPPERVHQERFDL